MDIEPLKTLLSYSNDKKDTIEHIEFANIISYKTSFLGANIEFKIYIFKFDVKKLCLGFIRTF